MAHSINKKNEQCCKNKIIILLWTIVLFASSVAGLISPAFPETANVYLAWMVISILSVIGSLGLFFAYLFKFKKNKCPICCTKLVFVIMIFIIEVIWLVNDTHDYANNGHASNDFWGNLDSVMNGVDILLVSLTSSLLLIELKSFCCHEKKTQ